MAGAGQGSQGPDCPVPVPVPVTVRGDCPEASHVVERNLDELKIRN